jgi:hypothetical protein
VRALPPHQNHPTGAALTTPPTPEQLADTLDELAILWPALPSALARDSGTSSSERVTTTSQVHTIPLNADVASAAARLTIEVPITVAANASLLNVAGITTAAPIPSQLRYLGVLHEQLHTRGHTRDAARLAATVGDWHTLIRNAFGLNRPDRPLRGKHCPRHDEPLTTLVEPGDQGWLRYDHLDHAGRPHNPWVSWRRTEAVTCRHCGATWSPAQYLWLGKLIDDADRRRAEQAQADDQPESEAA